MRNTLYIPQTITVGFQSRGDTFTGKLGYVIYTDHKGVLRKATSWNSWRDHKIEPVTFENKPQTGCTFNKGVQRDGHWGSGRSVVRVWDPRDFEFEISVDNLIGILMHSDVSKRDITEPCVYAWNGTELILLPTNSVEYQESVKHTDKQSMKVTAKSLVPGRTYTLKREPSDVVYLGYFDQYEIQALSAARLPRNEDSWRTPAGFYKYVKKSKKGHVFADVSGSNFEVKDPSTYIAYESSAEVHPLYPTLMEKYHQRIQSQPMIGVTVGNAPRHWYGDGYLWYQLSENDFVRVEVPDLSYGARRAACEKFARFHPDEGLEMSYSEHKTSYYSSYSQSYPAHTIDGLDSSLPVVQALVYGINQMIQEIRNMPDGDERNQRLNTFKVDVCTKFNLGKLVPVLANGQQAYDYYF